MPLPPALAARLAKRGIIKAPEVPKPSPEPETQPETKLAPEPAEEIIAEDYDEGIHNSSAAQEEEPLPYAGYSLCPNKWNVYHDCTAVCRELWSTARPVDPTYERRRRHMLRKYPLPPNWVQVWDVGIGRHYYWNAAKGLVSWLAPSHPRSQASRGATELRRLLHEAPRAADEEEDSSDDSSSSDEDSDDAKSQHSDATDSMSSDDEDDDEPGRDSPPPPPPPKHAAYAAPLAMPAPLVPSRARGQKRPRPARPTSDTLDPMDPAAYGDCARGGWTAGLPDRTDAKTGVDSTASGPLFQQRPYPSPGSVLRTNASGPQLPGSAPDQ